MEKNKNKKHYNSDEIRKKNVDERLAHISNIKPFAPEPKENSEKISRFFRSLSFNKKFEKGDGR